MKNKLLLTTAIASVAFAGSTFAETKIGGNLEQTFQTQSEDSSAANTGRGFGAEHNISLSASKDLDNGLTAKYGTVLEDGVADTHYLTVGTDTVSLTVGRDTGNNLSSTAIPHISDQAGTIVGLTSATYDNIEVANAHDKEHISLDFKAAGGTLTARYTPDMSTARPSDSGASDGGKSATEFLYSGSFGVDGLSVRIGQAEENGEGTEEDGKAKRYDIAYNFGQFAVGIGRDESESTDLTAAQVETETDKVGITFAASDTVSLGLNYLETERKSGGTADANDEEIIMVSVGYNFGGLGLEMTYAEVENVGNAANTDAETFQIRTIQKF
jgi:hypothetical protein